MGRRWPELNAVSGDILACVGSNSSSLEIAATP